MRSQCSRRAGSMGEAFDRGVPGKPWTPTQSSSTAIYRGDRFVGRRQIISSDRKTSTDACHDVAARHAGNAILVFVEFTRDARGVGIENHNPKVPPHPLDNVLGCQHNHSAQTTKGLPVGGSGGSIEIHESRADGRAVALVPPVLWSLAVARVREGHVELG